MPPPVLAPASALRAEQLLELPVERKADGHHLGEWPRPGRGFDRARPQIRLLELFLPAAVETG